MEIRCKDLAPKFPDAFERLRKELSYPADPRPAVGAWINDLPDSSHPHPSPREPLRSIQPPNSKRLNFSRSYDLRSRRKSGAVGGIQRRMEADNPATSAKRGRGRGRPRGGRGRGALERANPFVDVPPGLVLRPTDPSSSSSRRSPTRSPTRSKAPSTIVNKDQLAFMTPSIRFISRLVATQRGNLPPVVQGLWTEHIFPTLDRNECIPVGLKERFTSFLDTPRKTKLSLKPDLFYPTDFFNAADLDIIWYTFSDIAYMADQYRNKAPESHWIGTVVAPMLHLVRRFSSFMDADDTTRPFLEVLDITTTEISPPDLCPYSEDPTLFKDLDKRIDYAIGLRLSAQEQDLLQRGVFAENTIPSINQTSSFANLTPLFVNIEVKKRHVNKDPMIQLGAWIAAEFNKRKIEGYGLEMPVFAIAIDGDLWELHIVYAEDPLAEDDYRLNFLGPFVIGQTTSYRGMFEILHVLCSLAKWGLSEYRTWVETKILSKYGFVS